MSLEALSVDGRFAVLAIDHRDSMRRFLSPHDPDAVSAADLTELKIDLVRGLADLATGVMLEPEFSIPQVLEAGVLPPGVGFLAALEAQGYLDEPGAAVTRVLDGWSVEAALASGASAAKLLLPYHPDRPLAAEQERVAEDVLGECRRVGLPLVLEPLCYDVADPAERAEVVVRTARRFSHIGPDLLKLPFPGVADHGAGAVDRSRWHDDCAAITDSCSMPWALLSGGGDHRSFELQLEVALSAGCAGFMVGRALWGEAALAAPAARSTVVERVVRPRFARLRELAVGSTS